MATIAVEDEFGNLVSVKRDCEKQFELMACVLEELKKGISRLESMNCNDSTIDLSDIGNEFGIRVGGAIYSGALNKEKNESLQNVNEESDFINGFEHGFSLKNGTHDDL